MASRSNETMAATRPALRRLCLLPRRMTTTERQNSVSKTTDFVILGEKAGAKLTKAQQLGIKILNESDFENLISG